MLTIILTFFTFLLCSSSVLSLRGPIVSTHNGRFEGRYQYNGLKLINYFLGIPFAEPPVGDLRFRRPMPKRNLNETYIASNMKSQCVQTGNTSADMSEDCLYLNIWSPSLKPHAKLPVMFWIHGGGFYEGSTSQIKDGFYIFNGTQLALKECVIVSINYRLGIFGFLNSNSDEAPGNMGYWDQAMALNWTKQNIEFFGGNPHDITLFGQSAGGISISCHILSPITKHWFNKAIIQSGSTYLGTLSVNKDIAFNFSRDFAKSKIYFPKNNCFDDIEWIQCLKKKSFQELLSAQFIYIYLTKNPLIFKPIYGDKFFPKKVIKSIKDGDFRKNLNLLIGHTEMEGLSFTSEFDKAFSLSNRYNPQTAFVTNISKSIIYNDMILFSSGSPAGDIIATAYTAPFSESQQISNFTKNEMRRSVTYAYGDVAITCPTVLFGVKIVDHLSFNGNIYQYRLTYANSKSISYGSVWANVTHSDDNPLIFGRPFNEKFNNWTLNDRNISTKMINIWTHFAKHGSPPHVRGRQWPTYKSQRSSCDGTLRLSYVELNPIEFYSDIIHRNRYKGEDEYIPSVIDNCLGFWDNIITAGL